MRTFIATFGKEYCLVNAENGKVIQFGKGKTIAKLKEKLDRLEYTNEEVAEKWLKKIKTN